jgi:hypothetical protein
VVVPLLLDRASPRGVVPLGASGPLATHAARTRPYVAFQHISGDDLAELLTLAPLANPHARRTFLPLRCQRLDIAGGRGLCLLLTRAKLHITFLTRILGVDFKATHTLTLGGLPSRARVSPDGRYGAITAFVSGHSYAVNGQFSTSTNLIQMANGRVLANLEKFSISKDGKPFHKTDFNFWGVTFPHNSNRFYATLASGNKTYLIKGNIETRQAYVLRENVECPSLSPDDTHIAFKKRVHSSKHGLWRLTVLNLRTMTETPLAQTESVDDQAEWLDNHHLLYGFSGDIWVVPADGSGQPRVFIPNALSPSVVRTHTQPRSNA